MEDRAIVAALAAGDPAGIAAAYDTYAKTVYGYCRWMLREPAEAAEATRDTFVVAAAGTPADPGCLRSWFFATARGECLRRPSLVRGASAHAADLEGATGAAGAGEGKREAERAELRALIPATLAELEPEQREAVVLSLWHDLDDADLAAVFGVSRPEAYALASGGRGQLEKALSTLRTARTGRAACPELGTLLADWDGRLTIDTLHLARRHIEQCRTCAAGKRGKLRPEALARLLPLPALPAGLREPVLELCAGTAADAADAAEAGSWGVGALAVAASLGGAAGAAALAGWSKARGHPRVAAAVAVVAIAAAVSVPVRAAGSVHAIRPLVPRAITGTFTSASAPVPAGGGASVGTGTSRSPSPSSQPTAVAGLAPSPWSPPEPSPSRSPRPSRSASPKASPSSSSPSPSPSPSSSPTPTHTRSPSPSKSPSPTSSSSSTPSPSPSPSTT